MITEDGGYLGFSEMDSEAFRQFQLKCLDILVYFKKICDENKLTFFLAGGSAIGALRHGGFIPWDEDIDVFMPRPDYEKLTKVWNDVADTSQFIFCRSDKKTNYHHGAACVMDINTTCIVERNKDFDMPQGIVIDIIPLDGCPKSSFARKFQLFHAMIFSLFNNQRLPENKSKTVYRASKIMLGLIRSKKLRDSIWRRAEKKMTKYQFYNNNFITELIGSIHGMKIKHPIQEFIQSEYVEFEGHQMPLMKGYDTYLKSVFGDYMEPPPIESRFPKAKAVYINLNVGYENFRGKYYYVKEEKKSGKRNNAGV